MIILKKLFLLTALAVVFLTSCKSSKKTAASDMKPSEFFSSSKEAIDKVLIQQLYIDAAKAKLLEDYPAAIEGYKKVAKLDPSNHAAMYELAVMFYGSGQNEIAKQYITNAVKLDPTNKWYLILSAEILGNLKQYNDAVKIYEQLLKNYPEEYEFYYNWAFALLRAGKVEEAIKVYDKLEEKIGLEEELVVQKQKLYLSINKLDKAVAEIQRLINFDPKEPRYYQLLAELYQANNMDTKADEVYAQLLKIDPKSPYALLNLAENARKKNDRVAYMNYMREVFSNASLNLDAKIRMVFPYLNAFQKNDTIKKLEALELCKLMSETHPDEAKAHAMYADFLYQDNQDTVALKVYNTALDLDKSVYEVWQQVFFIRNDLRQFEELAKVSAQTMELFPNKPLSYFFNGLANSQLKKYKEAEEALLAGKELVIKNDPLKIQFYSSLGDVYNNMKEYAKSDSAYDAALALDENNSYVLNNYSYYLSLRNEKLDKAKKMSAKSLELEPNSNSFLDTYGWILYQRGEYNDAKKYIEKAIENGGQDNAVIIEHYGDVLYKLGDIDGALQQWIKAQTLGSESEFIGKKIAERKLYE
jgi:tetratricopeptide (TPR) repeat protein